jgi:putative ABC transport system ATP-binding protein
MKVLRVENLSKSYQSGNENIEALKKINLDLAEGEMLSAMGSSGSGKSTLLHILGALDKPDEGKIYFCEVHDKKYCEEPHATEIRSNYIGFVFQKFNLLPDFTVEENIAIPLVLAGCKADYINQAVAEKIRLVGLEGREKHRPCELSGGQQQRVAIARAIVTKPKILLADEPTGNLDYNTSKGIMELLCTMNKELNQSTIIVTHDPVIASYTDRILFFHDGILKSEYRTKKASNDISTILEIFRGLV